VRAGYGEKLYVRFVRGGDGRPCKGRPLPTRLESEGNLSKPTARKTEVSSGNKMPQEAKAANRSGNRNRTSCVFVYYLGITDALPTPANSAYWGTQHASLWQPIIPQ